MLAQEWYQYLNHSTCAFFERKTFKNNVVILWLGDVDQWIFLTICLENVRVNMMADLTAKGLPIINCRNLCPRLCLLCLEPALKAYVMHVTYATTTFANRQKRVINWIRVVPAKATEYSCLIALYFILFWLCWSIVACVKSVFFLYLILKVSFYQHAFFLPGGNALEEMSFCSIILFNWLVSERFPGWYACLLLFQNFLSDWFFLFLLDFIGLDWLVVAIKWQCMNLNVIILANCLFLFRIKFDFIAHVEVWRFIRYQEVVIIENIILFQDLWQAIAGLIISLSHKLAILTILVTWFWSMLLFKWVASEKQETVWLFFSLCNLILPP